MVDRQRERHALAALRLAPALELEVAPGVDRDHLAVLREQRPTAVAVVDRGVGLHHDRPPRVAADRRHQPRGERVPRRVHRTAVGLVAELEARTRMPEREHLLARAHLIARNDRERPRADALEPRAVRLHLQRRHIEVDPIAAVELRIQEALVHAELARALVGDPEDLLARRGIGEHHIHLGRIVDHVVVRDQPEVALHLDEERRARRRLRHQLRRGEHLGAPVAAVLARLEVAHGEESRDHQHRHERGADAEPEHCAVHEVHAPGIGHRLHRLACRTLVARRVDRREIAANRERRAGQRLRLTLFRLAIPLARSALLRLRRRRTTGSVIERAATAARHRLPRKRPRGEVLPPAVVAGGGHEEAFARVASA